MDDPIISDLKDFIRKVEKEAERKAYERVIKQIEQYQCHPDEIHCTCIQALKEEVFKYLTPSKDK